MGMDSIGFLTLLFMVVASCAAGLGGVIVGARRGVRVTEQRADKAERNLIADLTARVDLLEREKSEQAIRVTTLEREKSEQATTIAELKARIVLLETELTIERRITARIAPGTEHSAGEAKA